MKKFAKWSLVIVSLVLSACAKKEDESSIDPIASNQWCTVDRVTDDIQFVTRMSFVTSNTQIDYLSLASGSAPNVYKIPEGVKWERKIGNYVPSDKFSVEIIQDVGRISKLENYSQQKMIFDQIISKNENLDKNNSSFSPGVALSVKNSNRLDDVSEWNLYPCSSYTSTFSTQSPVRPLIEFRLILSQALETLATGRNHVSGAMAFTFPVNEIGVDLAQLENTQWCSWFESGNSGLFLNTITVGQNKFVENAHYDVFESMSEERKKQYLKDVAGRSLVFDLVVSSKGLAGQRAEYLDGNPATAKRLYAFVQDLNGTRALVKMDPNNPEYGQVSFRSIYFDCADPRPLEFSKGFKDNLKAILELQLMQLKN